MNLSYFLSKRIRSDTDRFSGVVHKIAIVSISAGVAVAIVAFLVLQGFKNAVKDRVYKFSSHLAITKYSTSNAIEETPVDIRIPLLEQKDAYPFVENIQDVAHKAGLIKHQGEVTGIVFKGISSRFSLKNFAPNMKEGRFIDLSTKQWAKEIVISRVLSNKMNVSLGDEIIVHFFQNPPRYRKLKVVGIYETNLSEFFDNKMIIGDMRLVRRLNDWEDFQVGSLEILIDGTRISNATLWQHQLDLLSFTGQDSSWTNYLSNRVRTAWALLFNREPLTLEVARKILAEDMDYDLNIQTVRHKYNVIFEWLNLLSNQVNLLLVIILIVICVNMISIILIIVMERIPMVGMLQAMGAGGMLLRKVFYYHAANLIVKGIFWGNVAGLSICYLQYKFKIMTLNPEDYYMNFVPIAWSWSTVFMLNFITFLMVSIATWLPARLAMRLKPISAIRFD